MVEISGKHMRILVVGHRGCAGLEPENTIRGFKRAAKLGCDAIEMDIRLTKDGVPVIMHDTTLDRTTNGKGWLAEKTLAQLKNVRCADGKPVPTLQDVIDAVGDKTFLVLELKDEGTAQPVLETLKQNCVSRNVELSSFWHRELLLAKKLDPKISTGVIISGCPIRPDEIARKASAGRMHACHWYINKGFVNALHEKKIFVDAWVVDEEPWISRAASFGVDAITSNRPDHLLKALRRM
ncbi:hypothetical protein HY772_06025 [Candidatus Woesearchaeota archaeon]|nr:hypothetical protein [Candidatus Woesearchaeota archaeon]